MSIYVLGDPILDKYIIGQCHRISPEAPIPILQISKEYQRNGGSMNLLENILGLGSHVNYIYPYNPNDLNSKYFLGLSNKYPNLLFHLIEDTSVSTPIKTRYISSSQQLLRTDYERKFKLSIETINKIYDIIEKIKIDDILVLSDYNKGSIDQEVVHYISERASLNKIRYIVDPHPKNFHLYSNSYLMTPNNREVSEYLREEVTIFNYKDILLRLKEELNIYYPCITFGSEGCVALIDNQSKHILANSKEVYDVTGAGDTFLAGLTHSIDKGKNIDESLQFANKLAGIAVSHFGAYVANNKDLEKS
ncbi:MULTISPECIES: PfkB family carbohydrate kinase [unclassified Prochlorococcus]|uniref:PfkB family carbohydrate kinase n=1 Tax=unclassified Prochlorococcus TaxID=2627481 RepID=UPI0005337A46|nr:MULTISPECIES: PfkB family carbohydrate kinase [unclassified Prochlorococcus]KGG16328.1 ADP-heptose synthase [Prochlorococcus sp. MIT 0603]KGG17938.1 ADP-heptose synthase [Prochlorococcus sp. MIT 0602]